MHPDGLTGDDVQAVLERCAGAAAAWHAPLLVADLAGTDRQLAGHLHAAFAEIARAETMEAP